MEHGRHAKGFGNVGAQACEHGIREEDIFLDFACYVVNRSWILKPKCSPPILERQICVPQRYHQATILPASRNGAEVHLFVHEKGRKGREEG